MPDKTDSSSTRNLLAIFMFAIFAYVAIHTYWITSLLPVENPLDLDKGVAARLTGWGQVRDSFGGLNAIATSLTLASSVEAVTKAVVKALQEEMLVNDTRHLTPREYAAKARTQESKVYEAIKTGKLIALPSELGTSNVRRWKIPQWAIQEFEKEQHRQIIESETKSSNSHRRRPNRAPIIFS